MNSFRSIIILVITVWFLLLPQSLQAQYIFQVEIIHYGKDIIGQRLTYKVKENIRKSTILKLSNKIETKFKVYISSMDIMGEGNTNPVASAISISYIASHFLVVPKYLRYTDEYLNSNLFICGINSVNIIAESIVADIDKNLEKFIKVTDR